MLDLRHDIRHALRTFRTQPGFTAAVLLTLGLGIGASTAMFSVLNAVLLRPLPQANADRLIRVYQPNDDALTTGMSPLEIADFREQAHRVVDDVVEYHSMPFTFIGEREPQRLQTGVVSATYFDVMGIRPHVGRTFLAGEDQPGAEPVLMLSYEYWLREMGADPAVVGRTLRMNDRTHTVVGVLPPFPQYPDDNDVYMPVSSCPFRSAAGWAENRSARGLAAFALVREGVTPDATLAELRSASALLQSEYPEAYRPDVRYDVATTPIGELIARPARATLVILLLATLLLLATVCSNIANLMIARVLQRDGEMAVRLAFGATRGRLLRQLLVESAVLAAAGGMLGLMLAYASTGLLAAVAGRFTVRASEISVDGTVLLFALAASATTALLAGLLPLSALRRGIATTLRLGSGRATAGSTHVRLRNGLIVLQVAVSLILLAGAGLLVRTLIHLQHVDTGFDAAGVVTARLDLNWTRYDSSERQFAFYRELEQALRQAPGIEAVGIGSSFPLNGDHVHPVTIVIDNQEDAAARNATSVAAMTASDGYFEALGVPLLRGRTFLPSDESAGAALVAVITRSLAERHWPGEDPVGRRVSFDDARSWSTVVGVVGDIRLGLESDFDDLIFAPHNRFGGMQSRVLARSTLPPAAVERSIRSVVAAIDPQQPITEILPLDTHRGERLSPYRLTAFLMGMFALISLGVTAVGLGSTIAFSIAQRTREIGIRVAIGARPLAILRMAMGQMMALSLVGGAIGITVAWYATRFMTGLTAGRPVTDLPTFAVVIALILIVTTLAGLIPALRALRINPVAALHD